MSNLNELNTLRVAAGMKPLKAWKESKAKLIDAIKKLAAKSSITQPEADVNGVKTDAEPTKSKKTTKKENKAVDGIALSTIAAKLDMNPKVARAKLRRAEFESKGESRWVFTEAQAKKVEELLKGDARKKA